MSPHCADGVYDDRNIPFPFPILQFIARNYITFPAVQSNIGQILKLPSPAECACIHCTSHNKYFSQIFVILMYESSVFTNILSTRL